MFELPKKQETEKFNEERFKELSVVVFNKLKQEYKQIKWDFSFSKSGSQIHYDAIISTKDFLDSFFTIRITYSDYPKSQANTISCYLTQKTVNGQPYGAGDYHFPLNSNASDEILKIINFRMNVLANDYHKKRGI